MLRNFLGVTQADIAVWFAPFGVPSDVLWGYISGCVLLVIGLIKISEDELPQARGIEKIMPFGRLFLAIPMAVFGTEHLTDTADIASIVPKWMPAHTFWAYLVGFALIAAALSITLKIQARLVATLLGAMFCCFVLMIHIPNIVASKGDRFLWAVGLRDIAFAGGAFAFAASQMSATNTGRGRGLATVARFFIGIPALFFGVEHFLHPTFATGVPLQKVMPEWIPGRLFWAYLTGAVLIVSGGCLVANKKTREAATHLGLMILLLVLLEYLPMLIANPKDIVSLNYFFDTLFFSGAVLVLAAACRERTSARS
ncbi:MAG: DoxX family membrane protein [Candidatus Acidiferrales bacterium]|jgi:uncharacterized membrane protein